jgi:hypothetical protein
MIVYSEVLLSSSKTLLLSLLLVARRLSCTVVVAAFKLRSRGWCFGNWGTRFIAPVGQNNTDNSGTVPFEYSRYFVMTGKDITQVFRNGVQSPYLSLNQRGDDRLTVALAW